MTLDFDVHRELIDVLKRDAAGAVAPVAARQRVALRLASAGAVGLAASVAGVTQAAATTSAVVSGAAAPSAGGGLASVTLVGLAKTLAVGLGLGAGVGLGLHVAFESVPPVTTNHVVAGSAANGHAHAVGPSVNSAAPRAAGASLRGEARAIVEPATSAESGTHVNEAPNAASVQSGAKPTSDASPSRARPSASVETRVNPGPELPAAPPAAASPQSLAEQQRLLERARTALGRGDASSALAFVAEHTRAFPRTAFEEERELLSVKALLALGRRREARAQATAFEARFPRSVFLSSLRSALAQ